jgi:hypothetical protein
MQSQTLDLDATITATRGLLFTGSIAFKMVLAFGSSWAAFYVLMVIRRERKEMPRWGIWLSISPSTQFPEVKMRIILKLYWDLGIIHHCRSGRVCPSTGIGTHPTLRFNFLWRRSHP